MGLARLALRRPTMRVDESPVGVEIGEVARPAQQQGVLERLLEMAVRAFDRAVLVRDAGVVARRGHAVMAHQRRVALGDVFPRVGRQIAERRRQAVAAVLLRRAAERPQRVLQALGQGREAFAAEHDVSVFEAGEDEPEVIEPVIERLPGDGDGETAGVGEVGQSQPARLVRLAEDHVLLGPMKRPPGQDASLQRAADVGIEVGMAPAQFLEHADHPDAGRGLEDRRDLGVPVRLERVWPPPASRLAPGRGQARIGFCTIPARGGKSRPGRGGLDGKSLSISHVKPHLAVGDVDARQTVNSPRIETNQQFAQAVPGRQRGPGKARRRWGRPYGRAPPSLRSAPIGVLILIVAGFSS